MTKLPKIVAIISIVAGVIMVVVGGVAYYAVHDQLADEHIVVSDDADHFAGEPVEGPFTAYAQATIIKEHALGIGEGKTYAELAQDDPKRDTVMTSSFLRASLFTSVVAFGVALMAVGIGVVFGLVGWALRRLGTGPAVAVTGTAPVTSTTSGPVVASRPAAAAPPGSPPAPPAPPAAG